MKKILFINNHLRVGGCEKSLVDVVNHLDYSKYQVDLLLLEENHDYLDLLNKEVRVIQYPLEKSFGRLSNVMLQCLNNRDWFSLKFRLIHSIASQYQLRFYKRAKKLFGRLEDEYDVIIAYRPGICTNLAAFTFSAKRKITWWHHGEYYDFGNIEPSYEKMDYIVAVSKSSFDILKNHYPQFKEKLKIVPNMIDIEHLSVLANQPFQVKDKKLQLVTVGRMSPEKNISFCIEIAKCLINKRIDFHWTIIGDGEEFDKIVKLIHEGQLEGRITLTGKLENPYPYIKNSDILIHPSLVESQGITILEAMALSVFVVVVDSAGPREYIQNMCNGIILKPDVEEFADIIYKIYTGEIEKKGMVDPALMTVKNYSPGSVIHQIEALF